MCKSTNQIETCGYREEGGGSKVEQESLVGGEQLRHHCGVPTPFIATIFIGLKTRQFDRFKFKQSTSLRCTKRVGFKWVKSLSAL